MWNYQYTIKPTTEAGCPPGCEDSSEGSPDQQGHSMSAAGLLPPMQGNAYTQTQEVQQDRV